MSLKVLRIPAICEKVGFSRATVYAKQNPNDKRYDPTFPKFVSLGDRAVGIVDSQLDSWIEQQVQKSQQSVAA